MSLKARISAGGTIRLEGQRWDESFPAASLPDRIALYVSLRDRQKGRYAAIYGPTVAQLVAVQALVLVETKAAEAAEATTRAERKTAMIARMRGKADA